MATSSSWRRPEEPGSRGRQGEDRRIQPSVAVRRPVAQLSEPLVVPSHRSPKGSDEESGAPVVGFRGRHCLPIPARARNQGTSGDVSFQRTARPARGQRVSRLLLVTPPSRESIPPTGGARRTGKLDRTTTWCHNGGAAPSVGQSRCFPLPVITHVNPEMAMNLVDRPDAD